MPRLFSSSHIVKVLQKKGFVYVSQKGSHVKFHKYLKVSILTVIVPANRKEIPYGTFKSILRQSRLTKEDFENI